MPNNDSQNEENFKEPERTLVLIKPNFVTKEIIDEVTKALKSLDETQILLKSYAKYTDETARQHYLNKRQENYYEDLVNYMTEDVTYGFVVEGRDVIRRVRNLIHYLRVELPQKYDLKCDVMRNVLHATSKIKMSGNVFFDIDSGREIRAFRKATRNFHNKIK